MIRPRNCFSNGETIVSNTGLTVRLTEGRSIDLVNAISRKANLTLYIPERRASTHGNQFLERSKAFTAPDQTISSRLCSNAWRAVIRSPGSKRVMAHTRLLKTSPTPLHNANCSCGVSWLDAYRVTSKMRTRGLSPRCFKNPLSLSSSAK